MLNAKDYQLIQMLIDNGIEDIKAENGKYRETIKAIHTLQNLRNKVYIASKEVPDSLPVIPNMEVVIWNW